MTVQKIEGYIRGILSSFKRRENFIWTRPITFSNRNDDPNEIATIARQDNERLGLITFVNTLVEIVVISPFHEAKIVK